MDCHFLLQGIFPTQGSNPGLPHCRQTLYHLSHQGSLILSIVLSNSTFFFWLGHKSGWPGIKLSPHALQAQNLNYWTAREVPNSIFLLKIGSAFSSTYFILSSLLTLGNSLFALLFIYYSLLALSNKSSPHPDALWIFWHATSFLKAPPLHPGEMPLPGSLLSYQGPKTLLSVEISKTIAWGLMLGLPLISNSIVICI